MQIKALRLTGFKSFVEPTELRIEPGLTGIVGPNGCGKSNLLEPIRWVMGESSPKSMRGGGMDDVIFAGTGTRPARDFAEVTLIGTVPDAVLPGIGEPDMPNELEVIRRIEQGSGSAYRVNGRDVRAKDVALVFADAATGAHSPALVSQGKIAAVISAKPAERRQMLEEAAGIAGLHVRRKDAEQKLRATETNLGRLGDILADMDARAQSLRRQARAAERYTKLTDQIRVTEGRMIFARWRDAASASDIAKTEVTTCEAAVHDVQAKVDAASERQRATAESLANIRQDIDQARNAANDVAQALAQKRSELSTLERRREDLIGAQSQIAGDQAREDSLAQDAAVATQELDALSLTLKTEMAQMESAVAPMAAHMADLTTALHSAELSLAQARTALANDIADHKVAEASLHAATVQMQRANQDIAAARNSIDKVTADAPSEQDVLDAENVKVQAHTAVTKAEEQLERASTDEAAASTALNQTRSALAETQANLAALQSEAAALQSSLRRDDAEDARISDELSVTPGYEAAVAAALDDGIEAPFGQDVANGWRGASVQAGDPPLPPGTQAIHDFVQAPDILARALAQIAVADKDDGAPLATGQILVTRDGHMRRWDGLVRTSGGSAAAARMVRQNRLKSLTDEIAEAEKATNEATNAQEKAAKQQEKARTALAVARMDRQAADSALRDALRRFDALQQAVATSQSQIAMLNERLSHAQQMETEAQTAMDSATQARAALPDIAVRQAAVDQQHDAAESVRLSLSTARNAHSQQLSGIAGLRERQAECSADIRGWKARAGEALHRIEAMAKRAQTIAQDLAKMEDQPQILAKKVAGLEGEREQAARKIEELATQERDGTIDARAADALFNAARDAHAEAREARAGAVARAESAELRRIEMGRVSGERFSCPPPLLPETLEFLAEDVRDATHESQAHERLSADRERIGPVNLVAAQELAEIEAAHAASLAESEELQQAVNRLRGSIGNLNREGRVRLSAAFDAVNEHFQRLFATLFDGGQAHLALVDSDDPLEAGLEIYAQPPGKKLATLTLLSGGEQALTAVALIFGLFLTNPAPICVLDEVDAPLDDANIERFCDLLNRMIADTKTRYLIVTHNAVTMARMHRLFGVTMVEKGVSRLVSVDLGGAEQLLAAE